MDFWASERSQVRTLQASLHEKTLIFSVFSVFDLGCYWLTIKIKTFLCNLNNKMFTAGVRIAPLPFCFAILPQCFILSEARYLSDIEARRRRCRCWHGLPCIFGRRYHCNKCYPSAVQDSISLRLPISDSNPRTDALFRHRSLSARWAFHYMRNTQ